jgi:aryl-alcohol dehydrogenase-like predicted oxidoreductase
MIRSEDPSEPRPTEPACANASHAGAGHRELSRRRFLQSAAVAGASVAVPGAAYAATDASAGPQAIDSRAKEEGASMNGPSMNALNPVVPNFSGTYSKPQIPEFKSPTRPMGKTGLQVSILGVGGFHLGTVSGQAEVNSMVSKALDHGINFFDNAWEYHKGMSEERVGIALKGKRDKAIVMTKVCTHGRKKDLAMRMLEESLVRLQTDHLDVWQVHEVIYYNDPELAYEPDGVLEALTAAKQQGKVRFVGFTGHKNPSIHLDMLNRGFAFDTVQMPINPFDPGFRSFESDVLPVAVQRGMAVFSMKSMGGSGEMIVQGALSPTEALSYAMSVPGISTTISGMDSMAVLDQNLQILAGFRPLNEQEMSALRQHGRQFRDGRYELFKSTVKYDGDVGREQHHFPLAADLPA